MDHLVLQRIGILDIANGTRRARDQRRDALIALAAEPYRPFDRGILADLVLPFRAHLREIVGEDERCPGTVGTVDYRDACVGQLQAGIEFGDRGIIPLGDLPQIDVGDGWAVEGHLPRLNAEQVYHHHLAADDRRKLYETGLLELLRLQRHVGSAEIDRFGLDLGNTTA